MGTDQSLALDDLEPTKKAGKTGPDRGLTGNLVRFAQKVWKIGDLPDDHPAMKWRDWPYWWTQAYVEDCHHM